MILKYADCLKSRNAWTQLDFSACQFNESGNEPLVFRFSVLETSHFTFLMLRQGSQCSHNGQHFLLRTFFLMTEIDDEEARDDEEVDVAMELIERVPISFNR